MSKNKLENAKTEAEIAKTQIEVKKVRFDIWLGVGNLILTAVIGIFVAAFISYRDEQTQKELIQLQTNIEAQTQKELLQLQTDLAIESSQANIEIQNVCMYFTSCDGSFLIKNTGPATAKNIKIIIVFNSIADEWVTTITDINNFTVKKFPATLDASIQEKNVDVLYYFQEVTGKNAFEIHVDELPLNGEFRILISLSPSISVTEHSIDKQTTLYFNPGDTFYYLLSDALGNYLENLFSVAEFDVIGVCENCTGEPSETRIVVSTLLSWGYNTIQASSDEQIIQLNADYYLPTDMVPTTDSSPMYLQISSNDGKVSITPTSQK